MTNLKEKNQVNTTNITKITSRRWQILQEQAQEEVNNIPCGYVRKREEAYHNSIMTNISKIKRNKRNNQMPKDKLINKELTFIFEEKENLGSRKWQHWITKTETNNFKITRETSHFYILDNGGRISKDKLIACII